MATKINEVQAEFKDKEKSIKLVQNLMVYKINQSRSSRI
jgi:hypothetical protein